MTFDETIEDDVRGTRLPVFDKDMCAEDMERMMRNAQNASNFLKAISHEGRLMILCPLASGEKSVTELEELLSAVKASTGFLEGHEFSEILSSLRLLIAYDVVFIAVAFMVFDSVVEE